MNARRQPIDSSERRAREAGERIAQRVRRNAEQKPEKAQLASRQADPVVKYPNPELSNVMPATPTNPTSGLTFRTFTHGSISPQQASIANHLDLALP